MYCCICIGQTMTLKHPKTVHVVEVIYFCLDVIFSSLVLYCYFCLVTYYKVIIDLPLLCRILQIKQPVLLTEIHIIFNN